MKAIVIDQARRLVWSEVPDPVRQPDEIVIDIRAAAVNRADLMQRAGNYPPPPGWPAWPGLEVAGTVAEAPPASRWRVGDRVCALLGGGGYAERVALPADMALPIPAGLDWNAAAAIPEVWATATLNLVIEAGMKAGDTVFIQAGAKVVTTVGTEEKGAFVKTLGADIVVNRKTDAIGPVLEAHPVDIALDCVGGPRMGEHVAKLAPWGRWIVIAALAGARTEIDLVALYRQRIRIIGSTLRSRTSAMKADILRRMEAELWEAFAAGTLRSVIYRTLPVTAAADAHAILERNENIGKVVLTV